MQLQIERGNSMKLDEDKLSTAIKSREISRVNYLYGEERFLVKTYTDRLLDATVGKDRNDINLIKLAGTFPVDTLTDSIDSMPLFADSKAVLISDLDLEKFDDNGIETILNSLKDVPDECTVIISMTGNTEQLKKAKNKKAMRLPRWSFLSRFRLRIMFQNVANYLILFVGITALTKQKNAAVCEFAHLTTARVTELIMKKAAKRGCVISRADAQHIAELTLCDLSLASTETDKLCSYAGTGEITAEMIDKLTIKQLDTSIYSLATELLKGNRRQALLILDDLIAQKIEPVVILAALSSNYIDFYRAKNAQGAGKSSQQTADDFGYAKNRTFVVTKAMNLVSRLDTEHIRNCLDILFNADLALKTSAINYRTVLEETIVKLSPEKSRRSYY